MRTIIKILLSAALLSLVIYNESFSQFNFVHITDLHVSDGTSYVNNSDINGVVFSQMLETIRNLTPKPAFVVASGDLTNVGSAGDGADPVFLQYLFPTLVTNPQPGDYFIDSAKTIPIYFTPGNHEYYTTLIPPLSATGLVNYKNYFAPDTDYTITYNNAALLFLRSGYDVFRPLWIDVNITNPEGSGISDSQCNWVRSELSNNANMRKIIVMHHPPVDAIGTNADGTPSTLNIVDTADGSILYNRTTLLNICDSNNVDIVLAGHMHQNVVADRPGDVIDENWTGGTRYIQTAGGLLGGYRIITVDSNFVWAGLPQILTPAGINGYSLVDNINVFYNSTTRMITVFGGNFSDQSNTEISILSITGQQILKQHFNTNQMMFHVVNAAGLAKGFYVLTIQNENKNYAKKLVVD